MIYVFLGAALVVLVYICMWVANRCWLDRTVLPRDLLILGTCFAATVGVIAFFVKPLPGMDLERYYQILQQMRHISLKELFTDWIYAQEPVTALFFYLISRIGIFNLLPAVSAAITVFLTFYAGYCYVKKFETKWTQIVIWIVLWIIVSSPMAILSGVRQGMAVSLLTVAAMRIGILQQRNFFSYLLLVLPALIHEGTLPYCAILLIMCLLGNSTTTWILLAFFSVGYAIFLLVDFSWAYLQGVKDKFLLYAEIEFPDLRLFVVGYLLILFFGIYLLCNRKFLNKKYGSYSNYQTALLIFALMSIAIPHLCMRTLTFLISISIPLISNLFSPDGDKEIRFRASGRIVVMIYVTGILAYQVVAVSHLFRLTDHIWGYGL